MGIKSMDFPERVYTKDEVKQAKEAIDNGYKHNLQTKRSKSPKSIRPDQNRRILRISQNVHKNNKRNRRSKPAKRTRSSHLVQHQSTG